jgi:hypothetical protein
VKCYTAGKSSAWIIQDDSGVFTVPRGVHGYREHPWTSYLMSLRKHEDAGNWKDKHWLSLSAEFALEEAIDPLWDRLRKNNYFSTFHKAQTCLVPALLLALGIKVAGAWRSCTVLQNVDGRMPGILTDLTSGRVTQFYLKCEQHLRVLQSTGFGDSSEEWVNTARFIGMEC